MAQVRINNPAGYFNGSALVQFGTAGGSTLVQLIDGVTSATGDGQYEVNFVQNELLVYGSGLSGPNIHVVKLTSGIPSAYDVRVLKLFNFLVVGGVVAGNRDLRVIGGIGNQNIQDGTISATKLDIATFRLENLSDVSVVDSTTPNGYVLTFNTVLQKWEAAPGGGGGGGGTVIALSSTPVTNPWNESGNPLANSILYGSTSTYTLPSLPGFLRIRAFMTLGSSSVGWLGIGVGDGTNMVLLMLQSNGDSVLEGQATVATGGTVVNQLYSGGLTWVTGDSYFAEMVIAVSSSTHAKVGGSLMDMPYLNGNAGASPGIPNVVPSANLAGPLTFYGLGSAVTDFVKFEYDTSLF
jgi:hypothetical protein